jgi:hypothetical protein
LIESAVALALRKPWRIPALLGLAWAYRARGWYRKPPYLPLPPREYVQWRNETAYGNPRVTPPDDEFERFVVWSSRMRTWMRG